MRRLALVPLAIALAIAGAWCGETYTPGTVRNGGSLRGRVMIEGNQLHLSPDQITKDGAWCGKTKPCARLVVGKGGGVKDAVVYIEQIAAGKDFPRGEVALLHQQKCEYSPHVLLMSPRMRLEIVNDDPVLHNVHGYQTGAGSRSLFNIAQPVKGQRTTVAVEQLAGANDISTTCDAGHPWMNAYIIRAKHPYYAVTDDQGRFELGDIPPGRYVLKMWHEGVAAVQSRAGSGSAPIVEAPYESSRTIEVTAGSANTVDFSLSLRASPAAK